MRASFLWRSSLVLCALLTATCDGQLGPTGAIGPTGPTGAAGQDGKDGLEGTTTSLAKDGTRLKQRFVNSEDGLHVPTNSFWDDERGEACSPVTINGVLRCVPPTIKVRVLYTQQDSLGQCVPSSRVLMHVGPIKPCSLENAQYFLSKATSADCSGVDGRIYTRGEQISPSPVATYFEQQENDDGPPACVSFAAPAQFQLFPALDTEVSPDAFAKLIISP